MPHIFEGTSLWRKTLAQQEGQDADSAPRERLRNVYLSFRERVAHLAGEINRELPDYTVHDITHLDALWEMADIIAGEDYCLTPTEAFVLGGAILLHDLGMGLASYPRGIDELRKEESWADTVTAQFQRNYNRLPSTLEIEAPPEEIKREVIVTLLRNLHAKHAEQLASIHWQTRLGDAPQYLIDDNEVRLIFGRIIGLIAHSHWWPVNRLEKEFTRVLGAPPWCPNGWKVDPLKIACLLRVADASHIDARRAPTFLRAIRKPSSYSDEHWKFQEKLHKPYLSEDSLTYSSGYAFPLEDAPSWWICLDTLKMIDRELRLVDSLLADKRLQRFVARRVTAIESPERLVDFIPTDSWLPVDAFVQVSDVPRLVKSLGGRELYGRKPTVPLRELIQNSADSIRVRRLLENRGTEWGELRVSLGVDENGEWLEVEDNGVGMSAEVLTKYLLDFGTSYWGSNLMLEEFPGLLSKGLKLTGKYGIGFFSVFMLGHAVRVRTRRADAAQNETLVLEFNTGLSSRPILRPAKSDEVIRDGGTSVRVWLTIPSEHIQGLLGKYNMPPYTLRELCQKLAPSLDVSLLVAEKEDVVKVVAASDWMEMDGKALLERVFDSHDDDYSKEEVESFIENVSVNLRVIANEDGEVSGRACIIPQRMFHRTSLRRYSLGVVTVGGLTACRAAIAGIFLGIPKRAARDEATPIVSLEALAEWASEQSELIPNVFQSLEEQQSCASVVWICGGDLKNLPIAQIGEKWVTFTDLKTATELPDELLFLDPMYYYELKANLPEARLNQNVIVVEYSSHVPIVSNHSATDWPNIPLSEEVEEIWFGRKISLGSAVMEALAEVWGTSVNDIVSSLEPTNWYSYRFVATSNGVELKQPALVIRRPRR